MKVEGQPLKSQLGKKARFQPAFMHPAIFIGLSVLLGILFALEEWMSLRAWGYHVRTSIVFESWGVDYLLWGVLCWLLWWRLGDQIQRARIACILTRIFPLSLFCSVLVEMIWVAIFPNLPLSRPHMDFWPRLVFHLKAEFLDNMVIFWCAFGLFRAIGYYRKYRENEQTAAQLEIQLTNAQIAALRMQLNPHFLFNTMNSISSLMRSDIEAADTMLEQLGSLLRITLERGDTQLIPLRDEIEFIEMYLSMQDRRFGGRVKQSVAVDAELHDALVPAMILQPIVENAYAHGLTKIDRGGFLSIEAQREGDHVRLSVVNNGVGLLGNSKPRPTGQGVGLANIKSRLQLHYGADHSFHIRESERDKVQVTVTLPLQISQVPVQPTARFGA
jgi:two-component system, LytTR family, sensor kinase